MRKARNGNWLYAYSPTDRKGAGVIEFALGVIAGIILVIASLFGLILFAPEPKEIARYIRSVKPKAKGSIIPAPSDDLYAVQSKFAENDANNLDTRLDELS